MRPGLWRAAWLMPFALAAYVQRFAVSWWMAGQAGASRSDPHAFGLLGDAILLAALAPPLAILLWWVLWRQQPWRGLLAPASSLVSTTVSVLLVMLIGAPTPGQAWSLVLRPLAEAWPALASALLWLAACAVVRGFAVSPPDGR